jgi:hypothetical protein
MQLRSRPTSEEHGLCVRRTLLTRQVSKGVHEAEGKTERNREIYREWEEVKRKYRIKERKREAEQSKKVKQIITCQ